jgi:hypothetical protein
MTAGNSFKSFLKKIEWTGGQTPFWWRLDGKGAEGNGEKG